MTALIQERMRSFDRWTYHRFPLAVGNKAWKHGAVGFDLATGKVVPLDAVGTIFYIGLANETVDATAVEKMIDVNLGVEIEVEYFVNGGDITAAKLGSIAYFLDDQTVVLANTTADVAGRIWDVSATLGVGVQKLPVSPTAPAEDPPLLEDSLGAFVAGSLVVPDGPRSSRVIDVPTTSAASTVTLPPVAADGTWIIFAADGVKNGHAIQYRDGGVSLTTALAANKRHQVHCLHLDGKWTANAYVSP